MKLTTRLTALLVSIPLSALTACSGDDDDDGSITPTPDIVALANATPELSTLASLIQQAGLKSALEGTGPFTVFAPTNAAFDAVPASVLEGLQSDPDELARVLRYHVVSGRVDAAAVVQLTEANTLADETVAISVSGSDVTLTDQRGGTAKVTATDIAASNGIVHLIDAVILPSEMEDSKNIVEVATDAGFSTLVSAAVTAGLDGALAGPGPFTVFAPTDAAFAALGGAVPTDADLLANVLLHHVVSGRFDSAAVVGDGTLTTLANTTLTVDATGSPITINGFALSETLDVEASNGIIHVVDEVIVPPTILEAAAATSDLSTLVTAVGAASATIQGALDVAGPITVFAPANSAFAAIPEADLNALLADQAALDDVLGYHVTAGQALSSDLTDGMTITMANGDTATVRIANGEVSIEDGLGNTARVVTADIRLLNGTVHVIDGVLFPPADAPSIVDIAVDDGNFGTLVSAATTAGLATTLDEDGPFTVFAPTDAAFTALGVNLAAIDADVIANILLYHTVPGVFDSAAVTSMSSLTSAANLPLAIDASGTPITIGGAELSSTLDLEASNGIVHVMNEVIVPPTILDVAGATPALSTLVSAVGLSSATVQQALAPDTVGGAAPLTVFAPTNDAFVASGIDLQNTPQGTLDAVLSHHVADSQVVSSALTDGQTIRTLNGDLTINVDASGAITVTDGAGNTANVVASLADIRTLTGVVHVIDAVLLPN